MSSNRLFSNAAIAAALLILITALIAIPAAAQWALEGVEVSGASGSEYSPTCATDGEGGVIVTWHDDRSGYDKVYAQRYDPYGDPLWTVDGVLLCTGSSDQRYPKIASDGAGGAYVAWTDIRFGQQNLYAQRVDGGGNLMWASGGVPVCQASDDQTITAVVSDGYGNMLVLWGDERDGNRDIYAQKINSSGLYQWAGNGTAVCTEASYQWHEKLCPDRAGGAFFVWTDERSVSQNMVYAQKISTSGTIEWAADGIEIYPSSVYSLDISSGGYELAMIVWRGNNDIRAQLLESEGVGWAANGLPVCDEVSAQIDPAVTYVGGGEYIVAWKDLRNGSWYDVFAQKIDIEGTRKWLTDGVSICEQPLDQTRIKVVNDGAQGAVIAWSDLREGRYYDIYAQKITGAGAVQWESDGSLICSSIRNENLYSMISDGEGGIYVTASSNSESETTCIIQRAERNGCWGYPAPAITGAADIPGDEGGCVNLEFDCSRLDLWPDEEVYQYTIWRSISPPVVVSAQVSTDQPASSTLETRDPLLLPEGEAIPLDSSRGIIREGDLLGSTAYWELIETISSYHIERYARTVPTLFDSTSISDGYHYFQVIAHAGPSEYWISEPDSARSVDNFSPGAPLGLGGQPLTTAGLQIFWDPNTESDLAGYRVYRGFDQDFVPGPENLLSSPLDTTVYDGSWSFGRPIYYKVSAVDLHENESLYAVLGPGELTGDDDPTPRFVNYLAQNHPNPFNPHTTIRFGLESPARVTITVYDAAGRIVKELLDERREAGPQAVEWRGVDSRGQAVSSGVYFYSLRTGAFRETRKMVLLR